MPSTESCPAVVFDSKEAALAHGRGGVWYQWKEGPGRQFPEDVASVWICMPTTGNFFSCEWTVDRKNHCNAQWQLSGTHAKPTLSPSLHWVGMWHGWLRDGQLVSC